MKKGALVPAVLLCALCVSCGPKAAPAPAATATPEATATPAPSPTATPTPTSKTTPMPAPTPMTVPVPTPMEVPVLVPEAEISQGEQVAQGETLTVDLADSATYRKLNVFLSNFSESHFSGFSAARPDYNRLAAFALSYAALNNPKMVEATEGSERSIANSRISMENIQWVMDRFFGTGVISGDWIANICEENGYYYGDIDSDIYGDGFTLVDSITATGYGDEFNVDFHIYSDPSADHSFYNYSSSSDVYSARPNELLQTPAGVSLTATPGTATVRAEKRNDGTLGFYLISYSL